MRSVSVAIFLCLAVASFCVHSLGYNDSHDLMIGQPTDHDVVIYRSNEVRYGFPFIHRTVTIQYPEPGQKSFAEIRAIFIKDNAQDGRGGYAIISAGGVGQRFVKITLKSQRGHGLNFTTTIYGKHILRNESNAL